MSCDDQTLRRIFNIRFEINLVIHRNKCEMACSACDTVPHHMSAFCAFWALVSENKETVAIRKLGQSVLLALFSYEGLEVSSQFTVEVFE